MQQAVNVSGQVIQPDPPRRTGIASAAASMRRGEPSSTR